MHKSDYCFHCTIADYCYLCRVYLWDYVVPMYIWRTSKGSFKIRSLLLFSYTVFYMVTTSKPKDAQPTKCLSCWPIDDLLMTLRRPALFVVEGPRLLVSQTRWPLGQAQPLNLRPILSSSWIPAPVSFRLLLALLIREDTPSTMGCIGRRRAVASPSTSPPPLLWDLSPPPFSHPPPPLALWADPPPDILVHSLSAFMTTFRATGQR